MITEDVYLCPLLLKVLVTSLGSLLQVRLRDLSLIFHKEMILPVRFLVSWASFGPSAFLPVPLLYRSPMPSFKTTRNQILSHPRVCLQLFFRPLFSCPYSPRNIVTRESFKYPCFEGRKQTSNRIEVCLLSCVSRDEGNPNCGGGARPGRTEGLVL